MGQCVGVELAVALERMTTAGVDRALAEDLLASCERGYLAALRENDDIDGH